MGHRYSGIILYALGKLMLVLAFFNEEKNVKKSKIGILVVVLVTNFTLRVVLEFVIKFAVSKLTVQFFTLRLRCMLGGRKQLQIFRS